jgi:hypothetical protein
MGFSLNPIHDLSSALHTGEKIAEDGAKGFAGAMTDAAKAVSHMSPSQIGHTALDIVGMVPVVGTVANLANAGWYAAQGDWTDAAWSAAAAIPIEGDAVDAAKLGKDAVNIAEDGATAGRAIRHGEGAEGAVKDAEVADKGAQAAHKGAEAADKGEPAPAEPEPGAGSPPREPPDDTPPPSSSAEPPEKPEGGKGALPKSVDEVLQDPSVLAGKSPAEVEAAIGKTPGWRVETLGKGSHQGQGWVLRQYTENGDPTGRMIRWHPGGGHHGPDPYWRVTGGPDGKSGIIR